jgi:methionyl-tRNA formyltransferase
MVNLHFSLLPRWRGAAPVERAILAGDRETGVCLMKLDEGLDTGPVYDCARVEIGLDDTAADLRDRLTRTGTELLRARLRHGLGEPTPQQGEPTYAAKVEPADYHLDWSRPAVGLHRVVRLGRAWTTFRGMRLKVLRARLADCALTGEPGRLDGLVVATGAGGLELVEVQAEGRSAQPAEAWRRGARPRPGERLGADG